MRILNVANKVSKENEPILFLVYKPTYKFIQIYCKISNIIKIFCVFLKNINHKKTYYFLPIHLPFCTKMGIKTDLKIQDSKYLQIKLKIN